MTQLTPSQMLYEATTLANYLKTCNKSFVSEYLSWLNKSFDREDAQAIKARAMDIAWQM